MSVKELKDDPNIRWTWSIESPEGSFGVNGLGYDAAKNAWDELTNNTTDEKLKEYMTQINNSFGVSGLYRDGYKINTSADMPIKTSEDIHWCPRRGEGGPGPKIAKDGDRWRIFPNGQRTCSYCGSLHPDDMLALMNAHGLTAIQPSTKWYKWYIARPYAAVNAGLGPIKYYRMHDTPELVAKLGQLVAEYNNVVSDAPPNDGAVPGAD